jgi:S-DNA-T family DNA segregation ATPase FtsK/SpoIIIE
MWSVQQSADGTNRAFMFMGIVTSVTAAFIGAFWALANYRYNKNSEKQNEETRRGLYRNYLERIWKQLKQKQLSNREMLNKKYPHSSECLAFVQSKSRRLWERNVNHGDFLTVRLGQGEMPTPNEVIVPKEHFSLVDDSLVEEPQRIKTRYDKLKNIPVCISLRDHSLIGVIGDCQETCNGIAQVIALQIAAYHAYTDVRMAFIFKESEAPTYSFAKWLPHTWNGEGSLRMMACDETGVGEVFYDLTAVLRKRLEEQENIPEKGRILPHYIIFISAQALVADEAIMKYLTSPTEQMGFTTVMLYGQIDRLPNNCTVIIQNDGEYQGYYSLDHAFAGYDKVAFDSVDEEELDEFARRLSGLRIRETHSAGTPPQLLNFLDMYKTTTVADIDVEKRWLENRTYLSFDVHDSGNKVVVFTNGKMIEGTWERPPEDGYGRQVPAKFYDLQGSEIVLNHGKTWICLIWDIYADDIVIE